MVKRLYILICILLVFVGGNAQTANQLIGEGNKLFSSKDYTQAEILYHKAIDKDGSNAITSYNLGRCLQTQKENGEAKKLYDNATKLEKNPVRPPSSHNNLDTVFQDEQSYEKAIEAYKNALRSNPNHKNTRYNLELCRRELKQQQDQQSPDKDRSNKDRGRGKKERRPQNQDQNKSNQKSDRKGKQPGDDQGMSRDSTEQLLNAAKRQGKEAQERLSKAVHQPSDKKFDKNW